MPLKGCLSTLSTLYPCKNSTTCNNTPVPGTTSWYYHYCYLYSMILSTYLSHPLRLPAVLLAGNKVELEVQADLQTCTQSRLVSQFPHPQHNLLFNYFLGSWQERGMPKCKWRARTYHVAPCISLQGGTRATGNKSATWNATAKEQPTTNNQQPTSSQLKLIVSHRSGVLTQDCRQAASHDHGDVNSWSGNC